MKQIVRFREFVQSFTQLVTDAHDEEHVFQHGKPLLLDLITHDDWLPDQFAKPNPERYQQYLLYCDPLERFSVVSFVWGPGHTTPLHDHTVWGMVGVMRGAERCEEFAQDTETGDLVATGSHDISPGGIDLVSPNVGDIHRVSNILSDGASVSIHIYGANIGAVRRHTFELPGGESNQFISGYSNEVIPNIWDRSAEI